MAGNVAFALGERGDACRQAGLAQTLTLTLAAGGEGGVNDQVQHDLIQEGELPMAKTHKHLNPAERSCIMLRLRDGWSSRATL